MGSDKGEIDRLQDLADERQRLVQTYARDVALLSSELRRCTAEKDAAKTALAQLERTTQEETEENLCVICTVNRRAVVFLPCGHMVSCKSCAQRLVQGGHAACPNCRSFISQQVDVYW